MFIHRLMDAFAEALARARAANLGGIASMTEVGFRVAFRVVLALFVLGWPAKAGSVDAPPIGRESCTICISIRVGIPRVMRGPAADTVDNHFTEIALPNGRFRGFTAHGETRAIDGLQPWDMGGPARIVLRPGKAGTDVLARLLAGQIITGTDGPASCKNTGEGDFNAADGGDGYYYAYCFRPRDGALIVARAPTSSPGPGYWKKFFQGRWDQPGLGGDATRLGGGSGVSVARWATTGDLVLSGWVQGGLGLFFTSDRTTLTPLQESRDRLIPSAYSRCLRELPPRHDSFILAG